MKVVVSISILLFIFSCIPYQRKRGEYPYNETIKKMVDPILFRDFDLQSNKINCTGKLSYKLRKVVDFQYANKSDTSLFVVAAYDKKKQIGFYAYKDTSAILFFTTFKVKSNNYYYDDYCFSKKYLQWDSIYANLDSAAVNHGIFGGLSLPAKEIKKWNRRYKFWKLFGIQYE